MAETSKDAEAAFDAFIAAYELKYDKAAECLAKDRQALLAFYDFPAEHWKHLRTSNPIESTFATVRHRTIRSKGLPLPDEPGARHGVQARRCGAEKLAQARWPQPVAQAHSRCQVHRRDRSQHRRRPLSPKPPPPEPSGRHQDLAIAPPRCRRALLAIDGRFVGAGSISGSTRSLCAHNISKANFIDTVIGQAAWPRPLTTR